jgi:nucleotidyltransferase substrate binding protein (TIGR01987 family)
MNKDIVIMGNIVITPLIKSHVALKKALVEAKSELERDGAIQRFEFTFELLWKTLKKVLSFKGINVNSPRDVFREAAKQGLIDDPVVWFEFIKHRNITSHTYDESYAIDLFKYLPKFEQELTKVIDKIKTL